MKKEFEEKLRKHMSFFKESYLKPPFLWNCRNKDYQLDIIQAIYDIYCEMKKDNT